MSLQDWQKNGWLRPHVSTAQEVAGLLAVIERDLSASADAKLDGDWRFAIAYNAALQCASLALKAAGYEVPKGGGTHQRTIESLKLTIGDDGTVADPLQKFRAKRGGGIYETTGIASETEIAELRSLATRLQDRVLRWLKSTRADLLPPKLDAARRSGQRKSQPERRPKRSD